MSAELLELRELAAALALDAGRHAREKRRALGPGRRVAHETKSSAVDPVTEFDRDAEAWIVERLRTVRPDDSIVGEEGASHSGSSDLAWHVDPIDGTVNFVYDLPFWSTSVAVVRNGVPIAGAVYAPVLDELYSAAAGCGATLNGDSISVSDATELAMSLIATGFSYDTASRKRQASEIGGLLPLVRDIRRSGSAALDLATVACGRIDGYYEEHLNSWDVAAGVLLVTEAGGVVTDRDGSELAVDTPAGVLVAPSEVHRSLLGALGPARF